MKRLDSRLWLIAGDSLVILLATLAGFVRHGGPDPSQAMRVAATWLPFTAAWFLVAPWLGAFTRDRLHEARQLWRPFLAAWIAAPLGAWLRALWLGGEIVGIFILVMAAVLSALLLLWRAAFAFASGTRGERA